MKNSNKAFKNTRILCICAILVAASVVIAYLCKFFTIGDSIRITFENLPIILCGYLFGPLSGFFCGICADFLNTAVSQYGLGGLNPILTLGAGCVGLCSGLISKIIFKKSSLKIKLPFSVFFSHIIGNMLIKSFGLWIYYRTPFPILLVRIPLYTVIGAIELGIIYVLLKSRGISKFTNKD